MSERDAVDVWAPARRLVGTWRGVAEGRPGRGRQERRYEFILREHFLQESNVTRWESTERNPSGEVHEDTTIWSYDRAAKRFVMRGFYVEGFVNEYICERADDTGFVFVTERIENGPPGMRARVTIRFEGDLLVETFDLAMPGAEFVCYTTERLARAAA